MTLVPPRSPPPVLIEIEDEDGARREYLKRFSDLCDEFFNSGHLHSEIILGMVEFSKKDSEKGLHVNWEILESRNLGVKDREIVMRWLVSIGITSGVWRYPEDFPLYVETKRQRRAVWHEQTANRLQLELERLITLHLQSSSKKSEFGPLSTISMLMHLNQFLSKSQSIMGAAPLVRGLRAVFEAQMNDPTRGFAWAIDDASLTQSGTELLTLSVGTLISTLGFKPRSSNSQSQREWLVNNHITPFQLYVLVRLIDSYKLGASGTAGLHQLANPPVDRPCSRQSWFGVFNSGLFLMRRPLARLLVLTIHLVTFVLPSCISSLL